MSNPNRTIYQAVMSPRLFQLRLRKGQMRINEDGDVEKLCFHCGEYWPADSEFFSVARGKPDGLSWHCKACQSEADAMEPRSHKK